MQSIVLSSLLPVVPVIAIGFIACRADWMRAEATKDLERLVFTVHVEQLDYKPVAAYFTAVIALFLLMRALLTLATVALR